MIYIENKRRKIERVQEQYPEADILDITSTAKYTYARLLSPFYPHGNIPVPFSSNVYSMSVEGIWQGLKVFESCDVDVSKFQNATMKGLKRTTRRFGKPLGHRKGVFGDELLDYFNARKQIYLPSYKWVLDNVPQVNAIVKRIADRSVNHDIVFLDYNTNDDYRDLSAPLSHACLLKMYIEGRYPSLNEDVEPLSAEEIKAKRLRKKQDRKSRSRKR